MWVVGFWASGSGLVMLLVGKRFEFSRLEFHGVGCCFFLGLTFRLGWVAF